MSRPQRYLVRMMLFLVAILALSALLYPSLIDAFQANPFLNGLIIGVLVLGTVFIFRQVLMLTPEVKWLNYYRQGERPISDIPTPRLLAPMASLLENRDGKKLSLSALSMRSLLDGIGSRLDESRETSRYMIGLLIFLGLLGTFWGLLGTVASVAKVIGDLSVEGGDFSVMFSTLQGGLEAPLTSMSTAFSSSLFGLAGSLILGFLELQAGQAQNRFYNELEDWLAGESKLSAAAAGDGEVGGSAYMTALMEQTAENLDGLQRFLREQENAHRSTSQHMVQLRQRLGGLNDHLRAQQNLMLRLAESQQDLKPMLSRMVESMEQGSLGIDDATRQHIRNMDVYLARLLDDSAAGRQQMVSELRSELKLLARTIAASNNTQS